jgi:hypothetical protein
MSDNDEEELRQALDKYTNAIRAERRAVDQGDSAEVADPKEIRLP